MNKNKAFTLIEVIVSLALFALVTTMVLALFDFATSSTTETEKASEALSSSVLAKELLIKLLSPSTNLEILEPITSNNLTGYVGTLSNDKEYSYIYSIDGVLYYRGPGTDTVGRAVKTLETNNLDLGFTNGRNQKLLNVDMEISTKDIEPQTVNDTLSIAPLNLGKDGVIKDSRTNKSQPSNIIRYVSEEVIQDTDLDGLPKIISATVSEVPIAVNSLTKKYNVPFYVSQEPRVVQLYNYADLVDKGEQIQTEEWINNPSNVSEINRADYYFKNNVIQQSTFIAKEPTMSDLEKEVSFVYQGYTFVDIYGNEYVGTDNGDGTRTVKYKIPTYKPTDQMKFAVISKDGGYVSYDFKVVNEITQPEIVRFEFLPEDNYQTKQQAYNLPYKLKTYINQNDVYYANKQGGVLINGTYGGSRPANYEDVYLGSQSILDKQDFYSTIVMPINKAKQKDDYYPNVGDEANDHSNSTKFLNSRVATITFKGTGLVVDAKRIPVPKSELSKLNGVEEVSVKVTVDRNFRGNTMMLDGEKLTEPYQAYIPDGFDLTDWFDPKNDFSGNTYYTYSDGKGVIFTALNGNVTKRYTFQHEYDSSKPDYHKSTNVDSGLNRVWVDGYLDGAWVGGSMRDDVSGDAVVTVPYDKYSSIKNSLKLKTSAYGEHLVQLPSYVLGTYNTPTSAGTDNYSYYDLSSESKNDILIQNLTSSPQASTRYNADYIKHFVLLQELKDYSPVARYQVRVEKSYPKNMLDPEISSIKIYDKNIAANKDRVYIKNEGTFVPHSDMYSVYKVGQKVNMDIFFAGSKIAIGNSINPNECEMFFNKLTNKECYYSLKLQNVLFGGTSYIHLFDYDGDLKETYKIMPNTKQEYSVVRTTSVYDLDSEMERSIEYPADNTSYYTLPFLPVKTEVPGISYGYDISDTNENLRETPIHMEHNGYDANAPLPYSGGTSINEDFKIRYADRNLSNYHISVGDTRLSKKRMYMRSTRTDYSVGGNNLNTASQYSVGNFMTPVLINKPHKMYVDSKGADYNSEPYNTDNWVGAGTERPNFEPSNVKLDTTGFSMQIFNDRVYDENVDGIAYKRSAGRPGTVAETTYDIALVDTTTDKFNTEAYQPMKSGSNANSDFKYTMLYSNLAIPKQIQTNDVIGYGFSLIEQSVDRDPTQDYLGIIPTGSELANATPAKDDRKVSLMFYTRQFFIGKTDMALGKAPASYVKIADLTGFDMKSVNGNDILNSQAVNFKVDVKSTYDGNTIITKNNYATIMQNNYIEFTVTELDVQNNPTGVVHYKKYSFADVFGGVRIDDAVSDSLGYNELNLLLNHRPRYIKDNNNNIIPNTSKVRLSVGYGTNWGLVGISDLKIMR